MSSVRPSCTRPRRAAPLQLLLLLSCSALAMGARGCERAVVGDECADASSDAACSKACSHEGRRFEPGDSFPAKNGCNTCSCGEDGEVTCTKRACLPSGCDYEGRHYAAGESFPASDGCNRCSCQASGEVECTLIGCGSGEPGGGGCEHKGKHYDVGEGFMDECNSCSCHENGVVGCTAIGCSGTGCGYGGKRYAVGESFPATDGCNQCSCLADGSVACTEKACGGNSSSGTACGGLLGRACADGQYCNYPPAASCGAADASGSCEQIPDVCDLALRPVCGCDDNTYANACQAAMAGVSVVREGECGGDPTTASCGGLSGAPCPAGQYCSYPAGASCGAADASGVCAPIPDVCADIFAPVCGCDDRTYGNACEAANARVSVLHDGECDTSASNAACGGLLGLTCPDAQYCNYPRDALCGAADATGFCAERPAACTLEYVPVCGCDGETYGNACAAAAEGVSVSADGPCS